MPFCGAAIRSAVDLSSSMFIGFILSFPLRFIVHNAHPTRRINGDGLDPDIASWPNAAGG
jgi:hypothetical protein